MTFGQNYSSNGFVDLDFSAFAPFSLKQYRQRDSEVDGWGTITTPYGTFECLRIHHVIQELDSVLVDFGNGPEWFPINIPTINEYEWWTNDQKGPILKVKANEIFGFSLVNEVMFRDKYRPELNVDIPENLSHLIDVFPNPATDLLHIQQVTPNSEAIIFDAQGKIVKRCLLNFTLEIKDLAPGQYFLFVLKENKEFSIPVPFIKQ
jgi:hypothetical protein